MTIQFALIWPRCFFVLPLVPGYVVCVSLCIQNDNAQSQGQNSSVTQSSPITGGASCIGQASFCESRTGPSGGRSQPLRRVFVIGLASPGPHSGVLLTLEPGLRDPFRPCLTLLTGVLRHHGRPPREPNRHQKGRRRPPKGGRAPPATCCFA